jgi:DNA-binding NtrC family response regulator
VSGLISRYGTMHIDSVLIVEDEPDLLEAMSEFFAGRGMNALAARNCSEAEHICRSQKPDAAILDYELPDGNGLELLRRLKAIDPALPTIFLTGYGSIQLAVEAIKLGADQFLTKPAEFDTVYAVLRRSLENLRGRQVHAADKMKVNRHAVNPFSGQSKGIGELEETAKRVLNCNSPILIQGETGTGKSVLARWFHSHGVRSERPFVDLNCAGLTRDLLETELFGHERGAFTGAVQAKQGLLEVGHKGTIFLDEIGDMDVQVQAKLLKVLEEKTFRRLGDVRERTVDIRLITATHHNLQRAAQKGTFRQDLYFRVSAIKLTIPPLRDRVEDIPGLAADLLGDITAELGLPQVDVSNESMQALQSYPWPGNIRELRNILERAVLLGNHRLLNPKDLQFDIQTEARSGDVWPIQKLEELEILHIKKVLNLTRGRVREAADKLGIPKSSLYSKIKQYGISDAESPETRPEVTM